MIPVGSAHPSSLVRRLHSRVCAPLRAQCCSWADRWRSWPERQGAAVNVDGMSFAGPPPAASPLPDWRQTGTSLWTRVHRPRFHVYWSQTLASLWRMNSSWVGGLAGPPAGRWLQAAEMTVSQNQWGHDRGWSGQTQVWPERDKGWRVAWGSDLVTSFS